MYLVAKATMAAIVPTMAEEVEVTAETPIIIQAMSIFTKKNTSESCVNGIFIGMFGPLVL